MILDIFAVARPHRRGQAAGRARPARVQPRPHARPVDAPRAPRAACPAAASAPAVRASRRSRPTAAWRATASRRSSAASSRSSARATVQRAERERAHLPEIALAGYTNAGKSTLLNALTGSEVGVRDRLFHTLDPTTRPLQIDGRPYLLTDTVGFIRKLPHQLVDAFGATLEETRLADLILHVVDASRRRGRAAGDDCARSRTCWRRSAPATGRGCSCSTRSTRSTPSAARSCASAIPHGVLVSAAHRRGPRRAARARSSRPSPAR